MTTNSFHGLRGQPFQEGGESFFGRGDIPLGAAELISYVREITPQRWSVRPRIVRGVPDVGAAVCADIHQALSRQNPDGRHHGVQRDPMLGREVSVRRESRTRGVLGAAGYVGAESVRDELLGGFALVVGHVLSVHVPRLKTPLDVVSVLG